MLKAKILFLLLLAGLASGCKTEAGKEDEEVPVQDDSKSKLEAAARIQKELEDKVRALTNKPSELTAAQKKELEEAKKAIAENKRLTEALEAEKLRVKQATDDRLAAKEAADLAKGKAESLRDLKAKAIAVRDSSASSAAEKQKAIEDLAKIDPELVKAEKEAKENAEALAAKDAELAAVKKMIETGVGLDIEDLIAKRKAKDEEELAKRRAELEAASEADKAAAQQKLAEATIAAEKSAKAFEAARVERERVAAELKAIDDAKKASEAAKLILAKPAAERVVEYGNVLTENQRLAGLAANALAVAKAQADAAAAEEAAAKIEADIKAANDNIKAIEASIVAAKADQAKAKTANEKAQAEVDAWYKMGVGDRKKAAAAKLLAETTRVSNLEAALAAAQARLPELTVEKLAAARKEATEKAKAILAKAQVADAKAKAAVTEIDTLRKAAQAEVATANVNAAQAALAQKKQELGAKFNTELMKLMAKDWNTVIDPAIVPFVQSVQAIITPAKFPNADAVDLDARIRAIKPLQQRYFANYVTPIADLGPDQGMTAVDYFNTVVKPASEFLHGNGAAFARCALVQNVVKAYKTAVDNYVERVKTISKAAPGLALTALRDITLTYDEPNKQFISSDPAGVKAVKNIFSAEFAADLLAAGDDVKLKVERDALDAAFAAVTPVRAAIRDCFVASGIDGAVADKIVEILNPAAFPNRTYRLLTVDQWQALFDGLIETVKAKVRELKDLTEAKL